MKSHYFVSYMVWRNGVVGYANAYTCIEGEFDPIAWALLESKYKNLDSVMVTFYAPVSEAVFDLALARDVSMMEFMEKQKREGGPG